MSHEIGQSPTRGWVRVGVLLDWSVDPGMGEPSDRHQLEGHLLSFPFYFIV